MPDDTQILCRTRVIRRKGQQAGDETFCHGGFKAVFNISRMYQYATAHPDLVPQVSFTVSEAGEVLKLYGKIDTAHADRMPPDVLHRPGISIIDMDAQPPVSVPLDGFHRLYRLHREGSSRPWVCYAFTLAQARIFAVQYEVLKPAGWRPVPWPALERAVDWSRSRAAKRDLLAALAG